MDVVYYSIQNLLECNTYLNSLNFVKQSTDIVSIFNSNNEMVSEKVFKEISENATCCAKRKRGFIKKYHQIADKLQFHPLYIKSNLKEKRLVQEYIQRMIATQLYGSFKIGTMAVDFLELLNREKNTTLENL
ncbi:hypothetical protein [Aquimarina latercula]|uniref:hypothetical protein n=1 Tax=Aquimarina latercula TaxID=987 RepID=UPI0005534734|nr:hypothetical protein [Aquimarina latercula]